VAKRAGVQIRDWWEGVWVTGSKSPCIQIFGVRYSSDFIFKSWLSFIFLSLRFYPSYVVSISLSHTSFSLFPFAFKSFLCFCLIVYIIFFYFISPSSVFLYFLLSHSVLVFYFLRINDDTHQR
jgi:hypothetical protein